MRTITGWERMIRERPRDVEIEREGNILSMNWEHKDVNGDYPLMDLCEEHKIFQSALTLSKRSRAKIDGLVACIFL